ncbi:hypothetical protein KY348_00870 [Candidatus Woesearchaeota archaeon]|nr:hypothetical protein [Candidatus Woesearchaeota archaeon]
MYTDEQEKLMRVLFGVGGVLAGILFTMYIDQRIGRTIPQTAKEKVEHNYVLPREIKIKSIDLDFNGKKETILQYKGKPYTWKLDEQGLPLVLKEYQVKIDEK